MAEFKKLSEVEQVQTVSDNATVLVEEGGEIKRVAKSEVGGAGGYTMALTYDNFDGTYCTENYDEMYNVLMAGGSVWVDVSAMFAASGRSVLATAGPSFTNIGTVRLLVDNWVLTDIGLMCDTFGNSYLMNSERISCIFPNGSHNLEPVVEET
jgi:hypothetical protein